MDWRQTAPCVDGLPVLCGREQVSGHLSPPGPSSMPELGFLIFLFCFISTVLGIKPQASCMLSKHSANRDTSSDHNAFILFYPNIDCTQQVASFIGSQISKFPVLYGTCTDQRTTCSGQFSIVWICGISIRPSGLLAGAFTY